jgi:hypothetical protein
MPPVGERSGDAPMTIAPPVPSVVGIKVGAKIMSIY